MLTAYVNSPWFC